MTRGGLTYAELERSVDDMRNEVREFRASGTGAQAWIVLAVRRRSDGRAVFIVTVSTIQTQQMSVNNHRSSQLPVIPLSNY
jgi:hypothetical protein